MQRIIFCIVLFFTSFSSGSIQVEATSWVVLEPQEVVSRAEVVVLGKYDFSSNPIPGGQSIFNGLSFEVTKVYKGEDIPTTITAGIDGFDHGWVDEFQQQGGEMLIFLERKDPSFLTPVGGPNGMIQINNGQVVHPEESIRKFYDDYLKEEPKEAVKEVINNKVSNNQIPIEDKQAFPFQTLVLVLGVLFIILFGVIRFRKRN
ncbi:hypothetical protein QNH48_26010 [Neobacillus sp. YX16]|uniref:hypothetical protein n=1 Tax=Neobacillus sp. YX16 TaxID=3047874 RepID=UPI0024C389D6|nr:hypothetical protein [Neobacillus sp. YX16]WHZ02359.1 hypothetical protein QNH48_26010 [Neobacillus sp. YX16]